MQTDDVILIGPTETVPSKSVDFYVKIETLRIYETFFMTLKFGLHICSFFLHWNLVKFWKSSASKMFIKCNMYLKKIIKLNLYPIEHFHSIAWLWWLKTCWYFFKIFKSKIICIWAKKISELGSCLKTGQHFDL